MLKEKTDIGALYRKAFGSFKPSPPASVWKAVQEAIPGTAPQAGLSGLRLWIGGAAVAGLVSLGIWMSQTREVQYTPLNETVTEDVAITPPSLPLPPASKHIAQHREEKPVLAETPKKEPSKAQPEISKPEENVEEKTTVEPKPETEVKKSLPETAREPKAREEEKTASVEPGKDNAWERHRIRSGSRTNPSSFRISYSETQTICRGESVMIGASNGLTYEWEDGQTSDSILVNPEYTTVYYLTVMRQDDRKSEARIRVNVQECANIYIPNAFTPNNDGLNDRFVVKGTGIEAYRILIQTQDGVTVYESEDISESWDGSYAGNLMETGTYIYRIDYVDEYGNAGARNGYILLFR